MLPETSIIEDITKTVNKVFWKMVSDHDEDDSPEKCRPPRTAKFLKAKAIEVADEPIEIEIPPIGELPAYTIRALTTNPVARQCWVEMSSALLAYLHNVVRQQLEDVDSHRKRPRHEDRFNNDGVVGFSKDQSRNHIRATVIENGLSKTKYFPIGDSEENALEEAKSYIREKASEQSLTGPE